MTRARILVVLPIIAFIYIAYGRGQASKDSEPRNTITTLTGILLVSDRRCDEWPENVPRDKWTCPEGSSQWGFITLGKQYSVWGNTSELKRYERRRVTITGRVSPGRETFMDRLDVESIGLSEMPESQIRDLIEQLRHDQWTQPVNISNPTAWVFRFTSPMQQILQAGPAAQDILVQYLTDSQIKDHIIMLLGGVGDGKAVGPIIHAMADRNEARDGEYARKVNLVANLALTNITVGDVIWHHGGGITIDACPDDPKSCWHAWWIEHRATFDVSKTPSRNFSNYPSYGIYQDPGVWRSESWR